MQRLPAVQFDHRCHKNEESIQIINNPKYNETT